jgi:hypothetical protein
MQRASALDMLQTAFNEISIEIEEMQSPCTPSQSKILQEGEFYVSQGLSNLTKRWLILFSDKIEVLNSFKDRKVLHSIYLGQTVVVSNHDKHGLLLIDTGFQTFTFKSTETGIFTRWLELISTKCTIIAPSLHRRVRSASTPDIQRSQENLAAPSSPSGGSRGRSRSITSSPDVAISQESPSVPPLPPRRSRTRSRAPTPAITVIHEDSSSTEPLPAEEKQTHNRSISITSTPALEQFQGGLLIPSPDAKGLEEFRKRTRCATPTPAEGLEYRNRIRSPSSPTINGNQELKILSRSTVSSPIEYRSRARSVAMPSSPKSEYDRGRSRAPMKPSQKTSKDEPMRLITTRNTINPMLPSPPTSRSATSTSYPLPPLVEDNITPHNFPIEEFYGPATGHDSGYEAVSPKLNKSLSFLANMLNNVAKTP